MTRVPARTALRTYLLCRRFGWVPSLAAVLLATGTMGGATGLYVLRRQAHTSAALLREARHAAPPGERKAELPPMPADDRRLLEFERNLGQKRHAEQQVKTLFAIAARNGLQLRRAEYRPAVDRQGEFATYRITMPVRGPYAAIRAFCETALLAMPFASLDEISFKKDRIDADAPEVTMRLTLYLDMSAADREASRQDATGQERGQERGQESGQEAPR